MTLRELAIIGLDFGCCLATRFLPQIFIRAAEICYFGFENLVIPPNLRGACGAQTSRDIDRKQENRSPIINLAWISDIFNRYLSNTDIHIFPSLSHFKLEFWVILDLGVLHNYSGNQGIHFLDRF